jgi:hypothetical protein
MLKMVKKPLIILSILLIINQSLGLQPSSSSTGLTPGKTGIITLTISNPETETARNTMIVMKTIDNPLTSNSVCNECLESSSSQKYCLNYKDYCYTNLGDIHYGNSKDVSFRVNIPESIESGVYLAEFELRHDSKNITTGAVTTKREIINAVIDIESINIKPNINIKQVITPEKISPGEEFNISIILENDGDLNAKDISTEIITSSFNTKRTTNKLLINNLSVGSNKTINYALMSDASLTPGVYEIIINTTYSDNENTYSDSSETGIMVDGETQFNLFIQDISPDVITKNSLVNALISVANIGIINAESVSIKLNPNSKIELSNVKEDYLGTLDPGDFTTTSFDFTPKQEGEINLNLTVTYTTPSGDQVKYNSTETIIIRFQEATITTQRMPIINWIIIVAVIVIISYLLIKKIRK